MKLNKSFSNECQHFLRDMHRFVSILYLLLPLASVFLSQEKENRKTVCHLIFLIRFSVFLKKPFRQYFIESIRILSMEKFNGYISMFICIAWIQDRIFFNTCLHRARYFIPLFQSNRAAISFWSCKNQWYILLLYSFSQKFFLTDYLILAHFLPVLLLHFHCPFNCFIYSRTMTCLLSLYLCGSCFSVIFSIFIQCTPFFAFSLSTAHSSFSCMTRVPHCRFLSSY